MYRLLRLKNYALTPAQNFPLYWSPFSDTATMKIDDDKVVDHLDLADVTGVPAAVPREISQTAVFYANMEIRSALGDIPVGVINHTSWQSPDPLAEPIITLGPSKWPDKTSPRPGQLQIHIPTFQPLSGGSDWIEVVINNVDDRGHPFHLVSPSVSRLRPGDGHLTCTET